MKYNWDYEQEEIYEGRWEKKRKKQAPSKELTLCLGCSKKKEIYNEDEQLCRRCDEKRFDKKFSEQE